MILGTYGARWIQNNLIDCNFKSFWNWMLIFGYILRLVLKRSKMMFSPGFLRIYHPAHTLNFIFTQPEPSFSVISTVVTIMQYVVSNSSHQLLLGQCLRPALLKSYSILRSYMKTTSKSRDLDGRCALSHSTKIIWKLHKLAKLQSIKVSWLDLAPYVPSFTPLKKITTT